MSAISLPNRTDGRLPPPGEGPSVTITVTDNNAAASLDAVRYDGKQSISIQFSDPSIKLGAAAGNSLVLPASAFVGDKPVHDIRAGYTGSMPAPTLTSWELGYAAGYNSVSLVGLKKGAPGALTDPTAATVLAIVDHKNNAVGLDQVTYGVLGTMTPTANLPTVVVNYTGQAFGQVITPASAGQAETSTPFLAGAYLQLNFLADPYAHPSYFPPATLNISSNSMGNPAAASFTLRFVGPRNGAQFNGSLLESSGANMRDGTMQGAVYGPSANEAAGSFAATGPNGDIRGGFVTGR